MYKRTLQVATHYHGANDLAKQVFAASIEAISLPCFFVDRFFRLITSNAAYRELVGQSTIPLHTELKKFHHESLSERLISALERSLEVGGNSTFEDFDSKTRTWFEYNISSTPIGLSVVMNDVSRRKVNDSSDSLHFALDAAQMGEWTYDAVDDDTKRSPKFNQIFGYRTPLKRWRYADFLAATHPDDRPLIERHFLTALENAESFNVEFRIIWPDLSLHWISLRGRVDINNRGRVLRMAGLVMDITAQKNAETEIQNARLAAEEANREKSYFLANMSHEIRTPLGAILGFAEALQEPTLSSAERSRYLQILVRNGMNLSNLIDDILDLSKVEAGYLDIEKVSINVLPLVEEVTTLLKVKADAKGVKVNVTTNGVVPEAIVSDAIRLRQILLNVVGNAIKFTDQGSVDVSVLHFTDKKDRPTLQILVKDTGVGISEEQAPRLFVPFTQADSATTRKYGGTGLGLTLSRRLARALGGDLVLEESHPGKGSCFAITIHAPIASASVISFDREAARQKEQASAPPLNSFKGTRILLAEDSPDNQELIQRLLVAKEVSADVACDGIEAVKLASTQDYDVILMDMQMPMMDGYQATRQLREAGFVGPIIALTANAMRHDREKCLEAGCSDYLSKPIDPKRLYDLISRGLRH